MRSSAQDSEPIIGLQVSPSFNEPLAKQVGVKSLAIQQDWPSGHTNGSSLHGLVPLPPVPLALPLDEPVSSSEPHACRPDTSATASPTTTQPAVRMLLSVSKSRRDRTIAHDLDRVYPRAGTPHGVQATRACNLASFGYGAARPAAARRRE